MFAGLLPSLTDRRVVTVDLPGHGRTPDVEGPFDPATMADDIAALVTRLDVPQIDLLGYSLGGAVALRTAIQHPSIVRRLIVLAVPFRRDGSYPEVLTAMDDFGPHLVEPLKQAPIYDSYVRNAPDPASWPALITKTGDLLRADYDWSTEVATIEAPTLLVFADADSVRPDHMVEFWRLLGGGERDAGVDGSARPAHQLAVIPGTTHYDLLTSPVLPPVIQGFLA